MIKAIIIAAGLCIAASANDIIGWRTDWTGKYESSKVTHEWSLDKNIVWQTPTPDWGNASPVIIGDKIFICSEPATLICVNKADGSILWQKPFITESQASAKPPKTHKVCGYSSMTPVSDGQYVYVASGYGTVACFDLEGKQVWLKQIDPPKHKWGTSASPVIADGKLVVHISPKVTAFELKDGSQAWQISSNGTWGTPLVLSINGQDALYLTSGDFVRAADGKVLSKNPALPWTCPISDGKVLYIVDMNGAFALELPNELKEGDKLKQLWTLPTNKDRKNRYYASPIIHNGLLYAITRNGHFVVIDATTGELVYEKGLKLGGTTYPSLVLAGERLWISSDTGRTSVVEPGREFKEVHLNEFEKFRSTPIIDGDLIYIRGLKNLYCIGSK